LALRLVQNRGDFGGAGLSRQESRENVCVDRGFHRLSICGVAEFAQPSVDLFTAFERAHCANVLRERVRAGSYPAHNCAAILWHELDLIALFHA
jgi:hypothetical protein